MNPPVLSRLGAACGGIFAIGLFVAAGDGSQQFSAARMVAGIAALTIALPFVAYVGSLLRAAEGPGGWLPTAALVGGVTGLTLKIASGVPELAEHRAGIADGTPAHTAMQQLAGAATVMCLYPLAIFCAAVAVVAWRTRALPRWIAVFTAVTAAALAVNGGFVSTDNVPGLLVFILWSLVTSVYLVTTAGRRIRLAHPEAVPAAA